MIVTANIDFEKLLGFSKRVCKRNIERDAKICKECPFIGVLLSANLIAKDREGSVCWVYNPELAEYYENRPDLRIN